MFCNVAEIDTFVPGSHILHHLYDTLMLPCFYTHSISNLTHESRKLSEFYSTFYTYISNICFNLFSAAGLGGGGGRPRVSLLSVSRLSVRLQMDEKG